MQHMPQKLFTRTRNIWQDDLWNSEGFFYNNYSKFMHPWKDGVGGRWLWTASAFLFSRSLSLSDQIYAVAVQPGKLLSCSRGNKFTTKDAAHKHGVLTERKQKVLQRCPHRQSISLSPLALGWAKAPPGWALHRCWDSGWRRINKSPTCMSWRKCSSDFI